MNQTHISVSFLVILLFLLILPGPSLAHKVVVFAWTENGMVHVEGGFGGKRPAKQCILKAMDSENRLVYQGKTDDKGYHRFKLPSGVSAPLTITMEAGPGHQGQWTLEKEDLGTTDDQTPLAEKKKQQPASSVSAGRIAGGIALIFGLAFLIQRLKKRNA